MTKSIKKNGPCFHLSLPRQRDVLSHTEFINVHILHALSLPGHPLRVTEKATHGKLVGPTLSIPRGDKYYNQYRPLCEMCPRDRGKVVETLQGCRSHDLVTYLVQTMSHVPTMLKSDRLAFEKIFPA